MDELKILGQNLYHFRKKNNFSYQAIGDALGISAAHVCRIENATAKPSFDVLLDISQLMNVPLYYLFLNSDGRADHAEFLSKVKEKLAEMNWSAERLSKETGLNLFKILDFLQERAQQPAYEDLLIIAAKLEITPPRPPFNEKMNLLEKILHDLGLESQQVGNILEYIRSVIHKKK